MTEDIRNRINSGKATDEDMAIAYQEWKAGSYTPGPETLKQLMAMEQVTEEQTPEQTEEQGTPTVQGAGNDKLKQFWNAWKGGKIDAYPTMKAVADTIAKNAQMSADRANVLTGKGSDTSIYTPIETEVGKIREKQIETKASTQLIGEALEAAKNGDYTLLAERIANGDMTEQQAATSLGMASNELNDLLKEAAGAPLQKNIYETEASSLEVRQMKQNMREDILDHIDALSQERTALQNLKRSLTGDDVNAFNDAVAAAKNVVGGVKTTTNALTKTLSEAESKNVQLSANAGAKFKNIANIGGSATKGTGKEESTGMTGTEAVNADDLLLSNIDEIIRTSKDYMEAKNKANELYGKQIDERISAIDQDIADLRADLKELRNGNR